MTVNELKRAFLDERPVAFGGITYQKITAVIYRKTPDGKGLHVQGELLDRNGAPLQSRRQTESRCQKEREKMTQEELNERVKSLIADMEEIGARPAYLRGGSYNDYLEYGRLKDLIAKECIEAFKAGFRFGKEATP